MGALTFNCAHRLPPILDQLLDLGVPVIAVDNASTDDTVAVIDDERPGIELVTLERNIGAAGRNIGVNQARTPFVAFCDDDGWTGWSPVGGPWRPALLRLFQFMTMDQMPDFLTYEAALRAGRAVVAVRVKDRASMLMARDRLLDHGGHFMNFFGRLSTEELVRWHGPELELPRYMRR